MHFTLFARSDTGGGGLGGLLTAALFIGALVYYVVVSRKAFRECGQRLGLQGMRVDSENLSGELRGMHLRAHFIHGDRNNPPHMAIEVGFSPCALLLELRRQTADELRSVAAGDALDLQTGDAAFDQTWIVEGAPAPRVLRLLRQKELRARLLEYATFPEARVTIEDGQVALYRSGTDRNRGVVDDTRIQLAFALAEAVAAESETPLPEDETAEIDEAASTYRSAQRRATGESAADKIKALKAKRGERSLRASRTAILIGHAIMPGLALITAVHILTSAGAHGSAVLAVIAVGAHLVATLVSWGALRRLQKATPGLSFDSLTRGVVAGSWAVLAAVIAVVWLR